MFGRESRVSKDRRVVEGLTRTRRWEYSLPLL